MNPHIDNAKVLDRIDHLVYATPDLDSGVGEIERLLGMRASAGGTHPNWGTRNALLTLGQRCYLEIIAPDPAQAPPSNGRPFALDNLRSARLIAWAANSRRLDADRDLAVMRGFPLGPVLSGDRMRADGTRLSWELTDLRSVVYDGVVPFLINWGDSPHPASSATRGATLRLLRAEHPAAAAVGPRLADIGLPLDVQHGPSPALIAMIDCPKGRVEIR
jgi:hypothetical protein